MAQLCKIDRVVDWRHVFNNYSFIFSEIFTVLLRIINNKQLIEKRQNIFSDKKSETNHFTIELQSNKFLIIVNLNFWYILEDKVQKQERQIVSDKI